MAWTAPKTDWDSIDGVADTDLNEVGENLVFLKAHADKEDAPTHGSAVAATPGKLVHRDASGRAQVADPSADEDIVNKQTHVAHSGDGANPHGVTKGQVGLGDVDNVKQMPLAGGTFTGRAIAHSPDTGYAVKQIRNIFLVTSVPGAGDGENGDVWFVYEV